MRARPTSRVDSVAISLPVLNFIFMLHNSMFFELLEIVLGMLCYSVKFTFVPQLMLNKCVYF